VTRLWIVVVRERFTGRLKALARRLACTRGTDDDPTECPVSAWRYNAIVVRWDAVVSMIARQAGTGSP
jgi:hypothetical protein